MRFKTLIITAVLVASVVGMAFAINVQIQEQFLQENTVKEDGEKPFRYDPEENKCYAYVWVRASEYEGDVYAVTTIDSPPDFDYVYTLVEVMEGELMDCAPCQYRCSAYYEACSMYGVQMEEKPTP